MTKKKWLLIGAGVLVVVCVLCGIIGARNSDEETSSGTAEEAIVEEIDIEEIIEEAVVEDTEERLTYGLFAEDLGDEPILYGDILFYQPMDIEAFISFMNSYMEDEEEFEGILFKVLDVAPLPERTEERIFICMVDLGTGSLMVSIAENDDITKFLAVSHCEGFGEDVTYFYE